MQDRVKRGILPEVLDKIALDKPYNGFYAMLRRLKPLRQKRVADLIKLSADRTQSFLTLLLLVSKDSDQVGKKRPVRGISRRQLQDAGNAFRKIEDVFLSSSQTYQEDAYALVITSAYVRSLLQNERMFSYLQTVHPDILEGLKSESLVARAFTHRGGPQQ